MLLVGLFGHHNLFVPPLDGMFENLGSFPLRMREGGENPKPNFQFRLFDKNSTELGNN